MQAPQTIDTFGAMLKFLRRRARLTQMELGIAVGYNEAHISRLENGQRLPDLASLAALFIPELDLQDEPDLAACLLELAARTRGKNTAYDLFLRRYSKPCAITVFAQFRRLSNSPANIVSLAILSSLVTIESK